MAEHVTAASPSPCRWKQSNKTMPLAAPFLAFSLHPSLVEKERARCFEPSMDCWWPIQYPSGAVRHAECYGGHPILFVRACQGGNTAACTQRRRDQLLCFGRVPPALRTVLPFYVNYT